MVGRSELPAQGADSLLAPLQGLLWGGGGMPSVGGHCPEAMWLFCRLVEGLLLSLQLSDKEAKSAMELLTDLAQEER